MKIAWESAWSTTGILIPAKQVWGAQASRMGGRSKETPNRDADFRAFQQGESAGSGLADAWEMAISRALSPAAVGSGRWQTSQGLDAHDYAAAGL
ncbi:hypothetical protein GKA01_05060 [Gluconobacter kanchanaburiensis NBRC 103587]|uniref:Uncharacterized protein n=1 Tax=Gluconobacter kanchanaburiensis NBRC 103587 TaxID=1307948 RepID=A0A511B4E6_9PROT|nr:hypothetical protein AA103587_0158 [Gluconobacter kanchanaburiensis NBRC 103587]GEK95309.1 hypothetical protein GKA01_05060 [Gluconobacter kanchanaburiensis NBRC 103587]